MKAVKGAFPPVPALRRRIAPGALRAANVTYSDWIPLCHTKKI